MTGAPTVCPRCSAIGRSADRFCESCGASLSGIRWVAVPRELQVHNGSQEPCADCGNETTSTGTAPGAVTGASGPTATRPHSAASC